MNFQQLFSAFLFLLFMRRTDSNTQEKVRRASGIRTFFYFVLTCIFGIFFFKTYQVKTISNGIDFNPIVASYDTAGVCGDTIHKFNIFHKLDNGGIYQSFKIFDEGSSSEQGGFYAEIWSPIYEPFKQIKNPHFNNKALKLIDDKLNLNTYRTCYNASITTVQPPSIFPFSFAEFIDTTIINKEYGIGFDLFTSPILLIKDELLKQNNNLKDRLNNGSYVLYTHGILKSFDIPDGYLYAITKMSVNSEEINTFNVFTAGDISQFSYVLDIKCPLHIDRVLVDFDQPIEILDNDTCIEVNPTSFIIKGERLDSIRAGNENLMFHVKLPTNTNLQIIRSLVLTTIFTALLALLFNNLYYVIRKWTQRYYQKHKLPVKILRKISRKRVNRYRNFIKFLL